jgi:hypothetical protein
MKATPRGARPMFNTCLTVRERSEDEAVEVSSRIKKTSSNTIPTRASEPAMFTVETVEVVTVEIMVFPP